MFTGIEDNISAYFQADYSEIIAVELFRSFGGQQADLSCQFPRLLPYLQFQRSLPYLLSFQFRLSHRYHHSVGEWNGLHSSTPNNLYMDYHHEIIFCQTTNQSVGVNVSLMLKNMGKGGDI